MKQRLIDANELELDSDWDDYEDGYTAYSGTQIKHAPTILTIPKNPTNGDMIRAMFPNIDVSVSGDGDVIDVYNLGIYCQTFDVEWWNAPYKAESEE